MKPLQSYVLLDRLSSNGRLKNWLWQELRLGPRFTSTSPLIPILHLVIQSCPEKLSITACIKFARDAFVTEIPVLPSFKEVTFEPFDNKNNSINKQCKKSNLKIVEFLEALEIFIDGDKQM